jgi:(hydroxyamino)benzene mutase
MEPSDELVRQGHRLLQLGMLLFLFALLVGLIVPKFAVPRVGLSTHLLGIMQGLFLVVIGLLWGRLRVTPVMSRIGVFLAVYGCFAAWTANLSAAIFGAGNSMLPIAAGQAHGSSLQEGIIAVALRSAAVSLIAVAAMILWGLRQFGIAEAGK